MEDIKVAEARKSFKRRHPYQQANLFSKLFFIWMFPLFAKGYKNDLVEDDIFPHLKSHDSTYLGDRLERQWENELKKKNPSLWKALGRVFGKELFITGACCIIVEIVMRLASPLLLQKLLEYYEPDSTMTKNEAYFYAVGMLLSSFVWFMFHHTYMLHIFHLGMKLRVATATVIYRKALKLNNSALAETTVGQMVNLISNDVGRFEFVNTYIHVLWIAPLETIIVSVLIYYYVGFSGLIGVAFILLFVPYQMWMGKKTSIYRLATAIRTDERIRLMNEIISGIQVIKMYTWEKPFAKLVEIERRKEMDQIKNISVIRAIMISFFLFMNSAATYLCILVYILTGNTLNFQYVYVLHSLYNILRYSVTMFFPQGIAQLAETNISVKRIRKFLLYDEVEFNSSTKFYNSIQSRIDRQPVGNGTFKLNKPIGIYMQDVSVKWVKTKAENILSNISADVGSDELAVIIGPVGSGKSTILHAILGELSPGSGTVIVNGKISYASQEPWLFVGTVRQNITFGQQFEARRYHKVVRVCQLQRDFTLFPYGDLTIVGERGISLSGGQRARINLARAVYKEADMYLLDDPLSAVDAHVGKQIFEECITGYLKNKCVVLVTHQLQYLRHVQKIYLLGDGKIDHSGTYEEVQNSGKEFIKLLNDLKDIIDDEEDKEEVQEGDKNKPIRRRISIKEVIPKNKNPPIEKEGRAAGTITWDIYKSYFNSGGHWCQIITLFMVFVIAQISSSSLDYFLKVWVNMNQLKKTDSSVVSKSRDNSILPSSLLGINDTFPIKQEDLNHTSTSSPANDGNKFHHSSFEDFWLSRLTDDTLLIAYSVLVLVVITLTIGRSLAFYRFCNKASVRLHNNMFNKIVYATMIFFNTNPSGRILNRFSKDMNQVDEVLPSTLIDTLQIGLTVIAITAIVASVNPWMLLAACVMFVIFYYIRIVYLATSRDIKRLEGTARSPVYSHLTASLQGLTTIRAFGAQKILNQEFDNYQNIYSSTYFMFLAANRALGFWLDMQCIIFVSIVTLSFLVFDTETLGGSVGLAITQSLHLTGTFQWWMKQWSELENTMTCVERIKEYADVVPERDVDAQDPPQSWPETGTIKFDNICLRYFVGESYVLNNLNFNIKSREKVGIVGRTGAGKSSIIMALFRLALNEGRIIIDNVDIGKIPLRNLRSSISIIPQEPVLFSGTLRKNLDPFNEYSDEALWCALDEVELKSAVSEGLESKMSEGGSNFSVGQRQLVCLARAIVRNNKILVLDEATANVDPQTDALIQTTIRTKFINCTVLTIAHRLHTIMDSDKVLVMDAGRVVEFGIPHELLQDKKGVFFELVQQTGKAMAENLCIVAEQSYKKNVLPETDLKT